MFRSLYRCLALSLLLNLFFSQLANANLLLQQQWRLQQVDGAVGNVHSEVPGLVEINKENSLGHLFFHCGGDEVAVRPGKTYELTAAFRGSSADLQAFLMISFPGPEPRTPFPCSEAQNVTGEDQTLSLLFTAREKETQLRIHFCLKGQGKVQLRTLFLQEYQPSENLLERPDLQWVLRKNLGGEGTVQKIDREYEVEMSNASGYLALVPKKDLEIIAGKHYRVQMALTCLQGTGSASLMLSMPGGSRTPYPSIQARKSSGQPEVLQYLFTALADEKQLRPHLVVRGPGKVRLQQILLQELSEDEFVRLQQNDRLCALDFKAADLQEHWKPHGALQIFDDPDSLEILAGPNGGFSCENLDWTAAEIKAIQVRFRASDEGGYLRLDFTAEENEQSYSSYLGVTSIPDGEWHNLLFPLSEDPAWRGKVHTIKLSWQAQSCNIALARLSAIPEINHLPFADSLQLGQSYALESIRPRGIYRLSWKNGYNPGLELTFRDRNWQVLATATLVAGQQELELQTPERTVSATVHLLKAPQQGYPVLTLENLPRLNVPPASWRGSWIWCQNGFGPNNTNVWFFREIEVEQIPEDATLVATGDDIVEVFVNGKSLGLNQDWTEAKRFSLTEHLQLGKNSLVLRVHNVQAWGGMLCDLYLKKQAEIEYIVSDAQWRCQVGSERLPQEFNQPVMVLGEVPVAPWGTRVNYRYVGPIGKIQIQTFHNRSFVAKVLQAPAVDSSKLQFRIQTRDGQTKILSARIEPSTGNWLPGQRIEVKYHLPTQYDCEGEIFLDTEYLQVENNLAVGKLLAQSSPQKDFPEVRIVGAGSRAWFVADGKKLAPIYYDLPGSFRNEPDIRDFLVQNAVQSGSQVLRFSTSMDDFWPEEGRFDFRSLQRCQEVLAVNAPDLYQIIIVKCVMPEWWVKKNPDDTTRYYGDKPLHQQKDRQALASKKYLQDAAVALRALLQFLRNSPSADRVIGIGISEGWNSEWFWSYSDGHNQPARSGFSKADYQTFRSYLKEKYNSDEQLAQAWKQPGLTFDEIRMPAPEEQDAGSLLTMLQPEKDMRLIDWFAFRNRAIAEAIIAFGQVVKEESQGKLLVGAYYGYLIAFSNIFNRLQTVGHLGIEETARSPYIDLVWAPSYYTWRYPGMNDSPMQAAESYTSHGKLVIVEQDLRTFGENSNYEIRNGQLSTVEQSVGAMNRAFGMALSRGLGTHWMEMYERWFREKVLLELIREQLDCYRSLPPVQGYTPVEICIVSDQKSAFYVKHNAGDGSHRALIAELARRGNEIAAPFRHVLLADLLEESLLPPHKFYIITNLFVLTTEERAQLLQRFEREKATVLWLYAPGAFYPERGPSADAISQLLGIEVTMETRLYSPQIKFVPGWPLQSYRNPVHSGPWFWPKSGFSSVLGRNEAGEPALVSWNSRGIHHYYSSLMHLPVSILRQIAGEAGVHIYNAEAGDPMHIGNDVVFLHAKTSGPKAVLLPAGQQLRAIAGSIQGIFHSGQSWPARAGQSYGFVVEKREVAIP